MVRIKDFKEEKKNISIEKPTSDYSGFASWCVTCGPHKVYFEVGWEDIRIDDVEASPEVAYELIGFLVDYAKGKDLYRIRYEDDKDKQLAKILEDLGFKKNGRFDVFNMSYKLNLKGGDAYGRKNRRTS